MLRFPSGITAKNDNEIVWLIKMYLTGLTLIENGNFNTDSIWTAEEDWIIEDGVAKCEYSANSESDLKQTISTPENDIYILEYDVVNLHGSSFTLSLIGGYSSTPPVSSVSLSTEYGHHRYKVRCTGSGDEFILHTAGMGSGDIIWIDNVEFYKAEEIYRFSSKNINIPGVTYNTGVLFRGGTPIGEESREISVHNGGGISSLDNFTFSISTYSAHAPLPAYFEPNLGGLKVSGKRIELGVAWESNTHINETSIFLLNVYYISEVTFGTTNITFFCIEFSDIGNSDMPPYKVQKDVDDGISYYPNCAEEIIGTPIPIIYGNFARYKSFPYFVTDTNYERDEMYAPSVMVDGGKGRIIASCHKCKSTVADITIFNIPADYACWKYVSSVDGWMRVQLDGTTGDSTGFNTNHHEYTLYSATSPDDKRLLGYLTFPLKEYSPAGTITDVKNVLDFKGNTYKEIDKDETIAIRSGKIGNTGEVGILDSLYSSGAMIYFLVSSDSSNTRYARITFKNLATNRLGGQSDYSNIAGTTPVWKFHDFGNSSTGKNNTNMPWAIDEICDLHFIIRNIAGVTNSKIRVYSAMVICNRINVLSITVNYAGYGNILTPRIIKLPPMVITIKIPRM